MISGHGFLTGLALAKVLLVGAPAVLCVVYGLAWPLAILCAAYGWVVWQNWRTLKKQ